MKSLAGEHLPARGQQKWFVGKEALWLIVGGRYDRRRRTRF